MILEDICDVYSGYAIKQFNEDKIGVPVIKIGNILMDGTIELEDCQYTTEKVNQKYYSEYQDIYIALSGATTGKIGILKRQEKFIVNQRVGIVRKKDNNIPIEFIKYFLFHHTDRIFKEAAGCAQPNISPKQIGKYKVPIIDDSRMKYVVEILDSLTRIINKRKRQLNYLDELIKARFVELFGDPLNNTKGWGEQRLGECCVINPKKNIDSRLEEDLVISFIPMASVSENGEILKLEDRFYRDVKNGFTYFCEGDVLFAKITPCMENGKGAVAVGLKNSIGFGSTEFHVLRPIKEKSNSYWLYVLTSFDFFRKKAEENMTGSAGQKRVQASFLENIKISVPPITLQIEFEQFVHQVNKSKLLAVSQPQIHIYKTLTLL